MADRYKKRKKIKERALLNTLFSDKQNLFFLISVSIVGFYLRVLNVGDLSLWVDEYVHVLRAKDFVKGLGPLFTDDNNGILLTIFILPFYYLFEDTVLWARIPSVLFGAGGIAVIYHLGRKMFNSKVGILSAVLLAFSLYNIYWSRLARNYAVFMFFFLLTLYLFLMFFENKDQPENKNFFRRYGIDLKYGILFGVAFVFSLLSHQLTFLFAFGVAFYFILNELVTFFIKNESNIRNRYFVLSLISLVGLGLLFLPAANGMVKNILSIFLPDRIVTWVIPNWEELKLYYDETPYKVFNKYFGVIKNDYEKFFWVGAGGFIIAPFLNRKGGAMLFSMFVIPFVLMSFVFHDPNLPRYLIFIYPIFLISMAAGIVGVLDLLFLKILKAKHGRFTKTIYWAIPVFVIFSFIPFEKIDQLTKVEKTSGFVLDRSLSEWSFTNWSFPSKYVNKYRDEKDVIISTVPSATNFYMDIEGSVQFRQRYFDTAEKKYKMFEPDTDNIPNGRSLDGIIATLAKYERGWLLADYYFYNVMTDPRVRAYLCQRLTYHPQASPDGSVAVLSWNRKNPPRLKNQSMLYVLGKSQNRTNSDVMNMNLNQTVAGMNNIEIEVNAMGLSKSEGIVVINKKHRVILPATPSQNKIETVRVTLKPGILKAGNNTIQVFYNTSVKLDESKGFSLHHLGLKMNR